MHVELDELTNNNVTNASKSPSPISHLTNLVSPRRRASELSKTLRSRAVPALQAGAVRGQSYPSFDRFSETTSAESAEGADAGAAPAAVVPTSRHSAFAAPPSPPPFVPTTPPSMPTTTPTVRVLLEPSMPSTPPPPSLIRIVSNAASQVVQLSRSSTGPLPNLAGNNSFPVVFKVIPDFFRRSSLRAFSWEEWEARRPNLRIPEPLPLRALDATESVAPGARVRRRLMRPTPIERAERDQRLLDTARSIRDPSFTLLHFHEAMCFCFPELRLYLDCPPPAPAPAAAAAGLPAAATPSIPASAATAATAATCAPTTMSGRTPEAEYLRTIGALHAIYWLLRLELRADEPGSAGWDGQRGFCFGVGEDWKPPPAEAVGSIGASAPESVQTRHKFLIRTEWTKLRQLLLDAGMLALSADGHIQVGVDRTVAMLALTAIHDVMKTTSLLPTVLEPEGYHGLRQGTDLVDHDRALAYVLEKDPEALPAYYALTPAQQAAVRFTQAELGFNHGWLVQAEAPPGELFASLKQALTCAGVDGSCLAFYFVHWLTDLAGAEPTPLCGLEKFVLKFPTPVLLSLVGSMALVQQLASTSPTALMLQYLRSHWGEFAVRLGLPPVPPTGPEAIALMRLLTQAQAEDEQRRVYAAFGELTPSESDLLSFEMALTGVEGEPCVLLRL